MPEPGTAQAHEVSATVELIDGTSGTFTTHGTDDPAESVADAVEHLLHLLDERRLPRSAATRVTAEWTPLPPS